MGRTVCTFCLGRFRRYFDGVSSRKTDMVHQYKNPNGAKLGPLPDVASAPPTSLSLKLGEVTFVLSLHSSSAVSHSETHGVQLFVSSWVWRSRL